jgi:hypothetical protein
LITAGVSGQQDVVFVPVTAVVVAIQVLQASEGDVLGGTNRHGRCHQQVVIKVSKMKHYDSEIMKKMSLRSQGLVLRPHISRLTKAF